MKNKDIIIEKLSNIRSKIVLANDIKTILIENNIDLKLKVSKKHTITLIEYVNIILVECDRLIEINDEIENLL